jgi:hypothetical protein
MVHPGWELAVYEARMLDGPERVGSRLRRFRRAPMSVDALVTDICTAGRTFATAVVRLGRERRYPAAARVAIQSARFIGRPIRLL